MNIVEETRPEIRLCIDHGLYPLSLELYFQVFFLMKIETEMNNVAHFPSVLANAVLPGHDWQDSRSNDRHAVGEDVD